MIDATLNTQCLDVVGRYAPSPSGRLHVGNLFSFMVAYIYAQQQARRLGVSARMVLRIEDLDPQRSKQEFADQIMRDMEWFGFEWDGTTLLQSGRTEAYAKAFERLNGQGMLYPCFCSRADLHAARAPHEGEEYVYSGACRRISPAQREQKLVEFRALRRSPSWRVVVPDASIAVSDALQGPVSCNLQSECGDFIVRRSDGVYAYQLAVVLDDAFQGVNVVVRGTDLLSSSFRQRFLQNALGLPYVEYAHVPLFVDATGRRLSKRNADASLAYLIEQRSLSASHILGHLAWISGITDAGQPATLQELASSADLSALAGKHAITWCEP